MKLAIIGTGMIAEDALKALRHIPEIDVTAIFARPASKSKGEEMAEKYSVTELYTDYDELLEKSDTDFIYIGNINAVHAEYAEKVLLAGKHVIIEKPICTTYAQLEKIWSLAQQKKLFMFEAVMFLHSPFFPKLQEMVGKIGKIRSVQCNYSKYSSRYDRYLKGDIAPVFDPACEGGTLLDLNIYNINIIAALFGAPSGRIQYYANWGYNGIDISGTMIAEYEGFCATCTAAKDSYSPCFTIIQGEKGYLMLHGSPGYFTEIEFSIDGQNGTMKIESSEHKMTDEFVEFEKIYHTGNYAACERFMEISLTAIKIADAALMSTRSK